MFHKFKYHSLSLNSFLKTPKHELQSIMYEKSHIATAAFGKPTKKISLEMYCLLQN